ncbi:MAG TPA: nitronate monooxygenase [Plantibacter sp.]|uniref:NAD(P)H-dependent flavin oxidoreductase n=1 Tax=unclassified Plantibacter TaxID=2624265 RepID=UPI002BBBC7F6|nr:nitronate monooxygenase [Plantibacter sp.]
MQTLPFEVPIVLGPFGGLSSVELTATVSELGGLGSFGLYGYAADRIERTAAALRERTSKPFALNLWVPRGDELLPSESAAEFTAAVEALRPVFEELAIELPTLPGSYLPSFEEQISAVLEARPAVISFVYGVPPREVVEAAHERGITIIGTATTVAEGIALQLGGVDAIAGTGMEAGGHRVSFLRPAEESLVGTIALIPQLVDAVDVPVIAAGGVADRRGVAAARALGADAVQVGTAFLRTTISAATDAHREALVTTPADGTVLTRAMSGRLARGIPNRVLRQLEAADRIAPFPVQNWLTGRFRTVASERSLAELQGFWSGQASLLTRERADANEVFAELVAGL